MKHNSIPTLLLCIITTLFFSACGNDNSSFSEPTELTPQMVRENHGAMFDEVAHFLDQPHLINEGEWELHYGDGAMYGPSFDLLQWQITGDTDHYDRGIAALEANRVLVEDAAANPLGYLEQLEGLSMSLLSLIEAGLYLDDETEAVYMASADSLLVSLDGMASALNDYLDIDQGEFAATTYGPTALSAFFALIHLEHILAYPGVDEAHHLQRAEDILDSIFEAAWDAELGYFLFAPGDERHMLYPSIAMMVAYSRAESISGDLYYRQRFDETYAGIQPLKNKNNDHYHSPYSAEEMGATDEDYTTLSSQNYLMLGLLSAYQNSGDLKYLEEIDTILGFIEDKLLSEGQLLHHWVNGRAANEEDPYIYCLGCNLQTLYILLLLESTLI
jgi:uncharacterized protein YyaL (SSP411 family)